MCHCDLLISDYSGAIIDYLITQKPIILYTPDLKSFKKILDYFLIIINLIFVIKQLNMIY